MSVHRLWTSAGPSERWIKKRTACPVFDFRRNSIRVKATVIPSRAGPLKERIKLAVIARIIVPSWSNVSYAEICSFAPTKLPKLSPKVMCRTQDQVICDQLMAFLLYSDFHVNSYWKFSLCTEYKIGRKWFTKFPEEEPPLLSVYRNMVIESENESLLMYWNWRFSIHCCVKVCK